jgi:hypothetical protein
LTQQLVLEKLFISLLVLVLLLLELLVLVKYLCLAAAAVVVWVMAQVAALVVMFTTHQLLYQQEFLQLQLALVALVD